MQHINKERQHRVVSLSMRLEAISVARRELLRQLEDLDAEARSVSLERNILHNLDCPTSNIPDEVLAMIFEEGAHSPNHGPHFGTVVSHLSHRWRKVALITPALWASLRLRYLYQEEDQSSYQQSQLQRACAFLSRSRSYPVDICIINFDDFSPETIQLISEHVGHCRQLRTRKVGRDCLTKLLECFSSKPIPLLCSIDLSSDEFMGPPIQLFPHGAPRLTTVQLNSTEILGKHLYIPAFSLVTCLRLMGVFIDINDIEEYSSFRDGLMALPSLHHLAVQLHWFCMSLHHLPIVLPTLHFLHVDASTCRRCLIPFIYFLHAESVDTLSLIVWNEEGVEADLRNGLALHLTSLKHLILADNVRWTVDDFDLFARFFPGMERLSVGIMAEEYIGYLPYTWLKLQNIATADVEGRFDACYLHTVVRLHQEAGHPIRRLMLPVILLSDADVEDVVELKRLVAIEDYYIDWPTPFEREEVDD